MSFFCAMRASAASSVALALTSPVSTASAVCWVSASVEVPSVALEVPAAVAAGSVSISASTSAVSSSTSGIVSSESTFGFEAVEAAALAPSWGLAEGAILPS